MYELASTSSHPVHLSWKQDSEDLHFTAKCHGKSSRKKKGARQMSRGQIVSKETAKNEETVGSWDRIAAGPPRQHVATAADRERCSNTYF